VEDERYDYRLAPPRLHVNEQFDDATTGREQLCEIRPSPERTHKRLSQQSHNSDDGASFERSSPDVTTITANGTVDASLQAAEEDSAAIFDWSRICCSEVIESGASRNDVANFDDHGRAAHGAGGTSTAGLPMLELDGSLNFFWIDAHEDTFNAPGSVFLFGKVKGATGGFTSCCATLKGVERNVFILPRKRALIDGQESGDEVQFLDVYKEVQALCRLHKITRFGCKRVDRSYCFEDPSVPQHTGYLKLVYSAELPALPSDASGTYFSHAFGTNTSCLESLLLKRKIMGPCWLTLTDVVASSAAATWCRFEVHLPLGKKSIAILASPPPAPPLVVASMHIQTALNAKHVPEVLLASVIIHREVSIDSSTPKPTAVSAFSAVRKPDGRSWPWDLQRTVSTDRSVKLEVTNARAPGRNENDT
jgi:hypothetical protein